LPDVEKEAAGADAMMRPLQPPFVFFDRLHQAFDQFITSPSLR